MKPIEQTAVECGAETSLFLMSTEDDPLNIIFENSTQLQAFFDARCAELSEPVFWNVGNLDGTINNLGAIYRLKEGAQLHIDGYGGELHGKPIPLYLIPQPMSQEVADYVKTLELAAQKLIERWHTPKWKDAEHTAAFINTLEQALANKPVGVK